MFSLYKSLVAHAALAAAALLVLIASGCGSSGSKTSSTETTAQKPTTTQGSSGDKNQSKTTQAKQPQDPHACGVLKINPQSTTVGTCNEGKGAGKHPVTFVNGNGTLKLNDVEVKVNKVSTMNSISGPVGTVTPKTGKNDKGKTIKKTFVVLDLTWKNKDSKTRKLNDDGKQLSLQSAAGGGAAFVPAEMVDSGSLYNAKPVKPDQKQKAQAIFQVPVPVGKAIKLRGANPQLVVWKFSTSGKKMAPPSGFIRLWNL